MTTSIEMAWLTSIESAKTETGPEEVMESWEREYV